MRPVRVVLRIVGWLLTPLVAWAASHFGGGIGATIAAGVDDPRLGLGITILVAAIAGFLALHLWTRVLRRSPQLRRVLHVDRDATPETDSLSEQ